ncbi:MAG: hypothetical protein MUE82_07495 [Chloroflexi bacterium]|nr:hypothetical protein [Chloroflexota bacterium]
MARRRTKDRAIVVLSAVALIALCVGCGGPVLGAVAPAQVPTDDGAPIIVPTGDAPHGWTALGSPWLGYTVAVPDDWTFTGHVPPEGSRSPHDVFSGPIPGSDAVATLVVGRCMNDDPPVVGAAATEVIVDGSAFSVAEVAGDEPGRTIYRATTVRDGVTWYLMACAGDDAVARDFFSAALATFRFPDADAVAPAEPATDPA